MKFNKSNAKYYGARGGRAASHHKSAKTLERERQAKEQMTALEQSRYDDFVNAESGIFSGFAFADIFHSSINKADAIITAESDDCAMCEGVNVGADGVTVYFFCQPTDSKKQVRFNRSVYVF